VTIPKPDGGERELSIPTVTACLIQQALLQVLQPILDPAFSENSPVRTRMPGGVAGERPSRLSPMPIIGIHGVGEVPAQRKW